MQVDAQQGRLVDLHLETRRMEQRGEELRGENAYMRELLAGETPLGGAPTLYRETFGQRCTRLTAEACEICYCWICCCCPS
jgi:hypothetical protein